jgi:hypothetical protein
LLARRANPANATITAEIVTAPLNRDHLVFGRVMLNMLGGVSIGRILRRRTSFEACSWRK